MSSKNEARVALVTGAARGLGQGFAIRLAADGHCVIALDRIASTETLAAIQAQGGAAAQVVVDLSDADAVQAELGAFLNPVVSYPETESPETSEEAIAASILAGVP